ncbi:hypothetical protein [Flavobacterium capsici]|uniref:DUF4199 domain-containing protein n=1 Tax=Flavobacterium capsici TaxID=3075618 RepID=A0AA96F1I4_9FLAO|nr:MULTISPECIES: hypothetical protein [unclassified Flavobacterium]WNM18124.1 hypothetical protein RN608_08870 [Flavobacterium sp. PMR2A8]WNM22176.1 hypothetical protein RN605_02170 [Flavobacterium sp. PMTSA4]
MKNTILLAVLLFCSFSFAQEITLDKGKFFVNGKQISTRETKQLLTSDFKATRLFKEAKSKESFGGLFLGAGITLTVSDLAIGLFSDVKYPTALTYAGVASMAISIPILSGRRKKIESAIDSYNQSLKQSSGNYYGIDYQIVANQNGIGIQLKF